MEEIKKAFPVLEKYTYLNTAASGILSENLMEWRRKHDLLFLNEGSVFRNNHGNLLADVRKKTADFINAEISEIALVPNFSFGFNVFLESLAPQSKFLLLKEDYPSLNWPIEHRGFETYYAEIDENLETNIEAAIAKQNPNVFAFSVIQYLSGIKIDLEFLKKLKKKYPKILFVADATQYLGTEAFDFAQSAIDVLGASTYKWMLAGYGNGIFAVKKSCWNILKPKTIGYNSANAMTDTSSDVTFIKHFEPGHQDTLNFGSLGQSIDFIQKVGMDKISEKIKDISAKAKKEFEALGLLKTSVVNRKNHSSIFNIKGNDGLFQKLIDANIICSQRGNGIRISFHFYNTENDLERLIEVIKSHINL